LNLLAAIDEIFKHCCLDTFGDEKLDIGEDNDVGGE